MPEKNRLRRALDERGLAVGTCVYSSSPGVVELAGFCGLDFCRIDNEHSWRRDESAENMMRAAAVSGIVPILRVDKGDPDLVRKALEIGAGGILVPHIVDAGEVEELVRAARFPPLGERGVGTLNFSARWGTEGLVDWMRRSNEEQLIGAMVEEPRAVEQLDSITSVEELDFVYFGATDYSVAVGVPGEAGHPKVQEALRRTIEAAERHGKHVCAGASHPWFESAKRLIDMGCSMVEVGHDISVLRAVWRTEGERIRRLRGA